MKNLAKKLREEIDKEIPMKKFPDYTGMQVGSVMGSYSNSWVVD